MRGAPEPMMMAQPSKNESFKDPEPKNSLAIGGYQEIEKER